MNNVTKNYHSAQLISADVGNLSITVCKESDNLFHHYYKSATGISHSTSTNGLDFGAATTVTFEYDGTLGSKFPTNAPPAFGPIKVLNVIEPLDPTIIWVRGFSKVVNGVFKIYSTIMVSNEIESSNVFKRFSEYINEPNSSNDTLSPRLPTGWYIIENIGTDYTKFKVINFIRNYDSTLSSRDTLGAMDGVHSLIEFENRFYIFGRTRGSTLNGNFYNWKTPLNNPDIILNKSTLYTTGDPRLNEDNRTIDYKSDIWSDRRGARVLVSDTLTGNFRYLNDTADWPRSILDVDTNAIISLDPRELVSNYDTNEVRIDFYNCIPFKASDNVLYTFFTTFFKDIKRYSTSIRAYRKTGSGQMYPIVGYKKQNSDFKLLELNNHSVVNLDSTDTNTGFKILKREWFSPVWDTGTTLYNSVPPKLNGIVDSNDWLPSYGGFEEVGQVYIQSVWESPDDTEFYIAVNHQPNPHYAANSNGDETWWINATGSVTISGSRGNADITALSIKILDDSFENGKLVYRPETQNSVKWSGLQELINQLPLNTGSNYKVLTPSNAIPANTVRRIYLNDLNANVTINGVTKSIKSHLEDIPVNKFPFYNWWKKAYNAHYNRNYKMVYGATDDSAHIFKIRKNGFVSWSQTNTNSPGSIRTKALTVNNATHVGLNANGLFNVKILNGATNSQIGSTISNISINSVNHFIELPDGLSSTIKIEVEILSGNLYGVQLYRFADPNTTFTMTGGTESIADGYKYHTFTNNGNLTVTGTKEVEVFMVGGGGAGGGKTLQSDRGAGGGSGGVIQQTIQLTDNTYSIVIGAGGSGQNSVFAGNSGNNTTGFGLTAVGGGGGGSNTINGQAGGSGGGGLSGGIASQGFNGGSVIETTSAGPGGGGKGSIGGNAVNLIGGSGGEGIQFAGNFYAAGGAGASNSGLLAVNLGGSGIGGNSSNDTTPPTQGAVNTGSGGGGARGVHGDDLYSGADGGSGIVIVRYLI